MSLLMQQHFSQTYIEKYLNNIYNYVLDTIEDEENLCNLLNLDYTNNNQNVDYSNILTQGIYLLRYAYAYIFEYKLMYTELLDMYEKNNINILSIGCGTCIDFDALLLLKDKLNKRFTKGLTYTGIDPVCWNDNLKHKYFTTDKKSKLNCIQSNLEDYCNNKDITKLIDVLVFPKSISEIY